MIECVCGHYQKAHTQENTACDQLVVCDPPWGYAKHWRVCPCLEFAPKRGCHPVGPSTDYLVCNQCDFSPMKDGTWQGFTGWDDHFDTHVWKESSGT